MGTWTKVKQARESIIKMMDKGQPHADVKAADPEPAPSEIYASELIDQETCQKCAEIDGHDYETLAEAEADYSIDGYKHCESESGCRGTLVLTYKEA